MACAIRYKNFVYAYLDPRDSSGCVLLSVAGVSDQWLVCPTTELGHMCVIVSMHVLRECTRHLLSGATIERRRALSEIGVRE